LKPVKQDDYETAVFRGSDLVKGKIAVVTGASRGIGRAIAITLGQRGATIIGTATSAGGAQGISSMLGAEGITGIGRELRLQETASIEKFAKEVTAEFGAPAILVNNAGVTCDQLLLRMKPEDWDTVLGTNLRGTFVLTKALVRGMMKARWGRIVMIGSVIGSIGNAGQANYAASKAGLQGFVRSAAAELGTRGITVNVVAPGFIETDMTDGLPESQRERLFERIPLQRLGTPEDISNSVGFLVSDHADYITGQTLHVNGGMYMG